MLRLAIESCSRNEVKGKFGIGSSRRGGKVGRKTVLVVDDERYIVDLLTDLLEEEGYHVRRAHDGIAALEEIDRARPDLVLADVMMPRLDGLTLANRLSERGNHVPVVLMSAAVTPRDSDITFIAKPFDIDDMVSIVNRALRTKAEERKGR